MDQILPLKVAPHHPGSSILCFPASVLSSLLLLLLLLFQYGVNTSKLLKTFLENHEFKTYNIQHECSDRELHDVKAFVERVVGH